MSETQLEKFFERITMIHGNIAIRNTQLKQLNFLKNLETLTTDGDYVLEIDQNPLLTRINLDKLSSSSASIIVKDNPKLDMSKYCDKVDRILNGSFQLDYPLTFTSILNVPSNLTTIYGDIIFQDTAINPERLAVLHTVTKLYGCLVVVHTNFVTLSFLENLEEIYCYGAARFHGALEIKLNGYLENLGLTKLVRIDTDDKLQIANNRILQLSFDEMEVFAASNMAVDWVWGFYPTDDISVIHEDCTAILGLLYYRGRSFTARELQKFQQITKIYGNIDLAAMDIKDLSMFSNLQKIISLNGTLPAFPAVALDFLPRLTSIKLPSLRSIYAPTQYKFNVDNCPQLNVTLDDCDFFKNLMHDVTIDYQKCDVWYDEKTKPLEMEPFI
ncbi:unnamed protein product [Cylicocyclus nassatus]|uniref:Receptor L-domain domain-containing protein n=1 Tax=Cylicocyclus nassatus TaxID=53992 RepID=A0AA36DT45_CYLNA|nr:unnamed protein product [Cylicocyclus nassatus]